MTISFQLTFVICLFSEQMDRRNKMEFSRQKISVDDVLWFFHRKNLGSCIKEFVSIDLNDEKIVVFRKCWTFVDNACDWASDFVFISQILLTLRFEPKKKRDTSFRIIGASTKITTIMIKKIQKFHNSLAVIKTSFLCCMHSPAIFQCILN